MLFKGTQIKLGWVKVALMHQYIPQTFRAPKGHGADI